MRALLEKGDQQMVDNYLRRKNLGEDLRFALTPGDWVLMRQAVPGKNQTRSTGPHMVLRHVGHNSLGVELLT